MHFQEKDETDSGYRSGTIPDDKLPRVPSQDTLDRQELKRKIAKFNHFVPSVSLKVVSSSLYVMKNKNAWQNLSCALVS